MRRIVLWLLSTVTVVVLLFGYHTSTTGALSQATTVISSAPLPATSSSKKSTTSPAASASPSSSPAAPTTVTGDVANTQWGPVQVRITVDAGAITAVEVPVYPSGNSRDAEINSYALPILVQDTMDAQSADVQMISGATVTSTGYLQSLQSALDRAGL